MAQKDVTIDDILNGGGSSGTQPVQPSAAATPPVVQGVADYGNGEDIKQKPVTTAEATDPTQAAVNLVEQRRKEQAQQMTSVPPVDRHLDGAAEFMNYERAQNGQTPEKSPVFTGNVQTTSPSVATGANGDGGKDKDAAAVNTEPKETKDGKKSAMSYADMFAAMEPYKEPTKEQLEKERKKEKRERLFAAIGDGISALSNLFFTTQYAPNMYDPNKETNSEKVENYWTKLRDEREANRRRYVDGYLKAKQADDLHDIQQQNADVNDFYKRSEAERKSKAQEIIDAKTQAMTDYYKEKAKGVGKYDEAQLVYLKTKIDCLNKGMSIKEAVAAAQIAKLNAEANKANRTGGSGGSGGRTGGSGGRSGGKSGVSKSGGGYPWYDKNGVLHYAKTEGIAKQMSKQNGTYRDDYSTNRSSMVDSNGKQIGVGTSRTTHNGWHSVRPQNHTQPNGGHSVRPKVPAKPVKKGGGAKGGKWASGLKL